MQGHEGVDAIKQEQMPLGQMLLWIKAVERVLWEEAAKGQSFVTLRVKLHVITRLYFYSQLFIG